MSRSTEVLYSNDDYLVRYPVHSPRKYMVSQHLQDKGLEFTTEFVEYPDIEPVCKELGVKPTSKKEDGTDLYTLPAIYDPSTGVYVADSFPIAQYLDKTYPDTPPIFPRNTVGLHRAFTLSFAQHIEPLWDFIIPYTCFMLNPRSSEYFRRTREASFGKTMEELIPKGDGAVGNWDVLREGFSKIAYVYSFTDDMGPFLMGDEITWGDLLLCSFLSWMKIVWGEDDQKWKDVMKWDGGRWERLFNDLQKYAV
ncbi:Glutathione S-transferase-like protein ustS [Psilocybe cubensis]|uniref:Glutathione S-transferase-like protein ustS n=2 Tax=Psilocybe cubensis TaxID=181762 RepID=A0ACB8H070_PSICU|nr:Glutathione S-transferase-like protein ustS [Psilocybe cubensis]KAH9480881.1 Glutathione S-transferase-like protein ustS [Psilocybe cubensis]